MNSEPDLDHNFNRGLNIIETKCDDISWLVRLWTHINFIGSGQPYLENTEGPWYQGLESYVK